MSAKRCTSGRKIRYRDAFEAGIALEQVRSSRFDRGSEKVEQYVYFCRFCRGWHLSSIGLGDRARVTTPKPLTNPSTKSASTQARRHAG